MNRYRRKVLEIYQRSGRLKFVMRAVQHCSVALRTRPTLERLSHLSTIAHPTAYRCAALLLQRGAYSGSRSGRGLTSEALRMRCGPILLLGRK
jgi:hypothetical protein